MFIIARCDKINRELLKEGEILEYDNIERIKLDNKEIILIGTAHVSKKSAEQVKEIIENEEPDSVCVELDEERFSSIGNEDKWKEMDIFKVIKQKKSLLLLVNLIISSFQKRLAKKFGINAGQEMIQGIKSAKEIEANLVLADRNIQITFKRVWRGLGLWEKLKLIFQIIAMLFSDLEMSEEELDELKKGNALSIILAEISETFPGIKHYLVDERDKYLSHKIKNAPGNKIVAVLGAAHLPGVKKELDNDQDIEALNQLPSTSNLGRYIAWLVPLLIVGVIAYTFFTNRSASLEQLSTWIIWNGSLSALGVLLARGHILTILTAFIVAPISSLNPTIAAGWFAGIVESLVRKPQVKDFENLAEGISIKDLWRNKVTVVLMVVVLANMGSVLGTVIGGADVIKHFINALS